MTDHLTTEQRKWNMSRVRSSDTKPEFMLRSLLHRAGFRFSLKRKDVFGKPDIVLPKYNCVIFVHGCYWHRHPGCKRATTPATNREKWLTKFEKNVARDKMVKETLEQQGWQVIVVWECELKKEPYTVLKSIIAAIAPEKKQKAVYSDKKEILQVAEERFVSKFKDNKTDEKI